MLAGLPLRRPFCLPRLRLSGLGDRCKVVDLVFVFPVPQGPCQRVAYIANLAVEEKKDYEEACGVSVPFSVAVSYAIWLPCQQVCFCKSVHKYKSKAEGPDAPVYTLMGEEQEQPATAATSAEHPANGPISSA